MSEHRAVRWIRFRSPEALLRSYWVGIARKSGWRASEVVVPGEMVQALRFERMWAFVTTDSKVPVVTRRAGHVTGKRARGHVAEEDRADEYGRVAMAVYRRLSQKRTRRSPTRSTA